MFGIYHFFTFLLDMRPILPKTASLAKFYNHPPGVVYLNRSGFPTMVLRSNLGQEPLGGEIIGLLEGKSLLTPTFESHLPCGEISIGSLGHSKAAEIAKSIRQSDDDARPRELREVYYLIRNRHPLFTTICLVHGSFFATVTSEQLVRDTLRQVIYDSADSAFSVSADALNKLADLLAVECFSDRLRSVHNATVSLRLAICAEVEERANILNANYFPEIRNDTISLVLPVSSAKDLAKRKRHLRQALSSIELEQGAESTITHPFNGNFFVLSYSL
ncbi:MAG: hypothetical protein OXE46_08225 [Chloroflexi bacterium]|nr:hypothetical protein [Chloroflexota bacterium]